MELRFITEFGNHLGVTSYFYVVNKDNKVTAELLSKEQVRFQILDKGMTFLHQSLMNDWERESVWTCYKEWNLY